MGYDLDGIGMARPAMVHQRISRNIVINYYVKHGFDTIEALQESTANLKPTCEQIPDVVFVDVATNKVIVSVELDKAWLKITRVRIEEALTKYKHKEVFWYNYTRDEWERHYLYKGNFECDIMEDYSQQLKIHLSDYITLE